jgi:hypothetical protein
MKKLWKFTFLAVTANGSKEITIRELSDKYHLLELPCLSHFEHSEVPRTGYWFHR